ncbi:MAG: hypothetical protein M9932_00945 [Xanthobacteraceae bacterium]|nr:hypothetical protein [Xanthobacteraceae bacterium]
MRNSFPPRNSVLAVALLAPLLAGCAGASMSDVFSSDLVSKDAQWFSRAGQVLNKNVSIETPPLTPERPVTPEDLISADGQCPGLAPAGAGAAAEGPAGAIPTPTGRVALGHTECDVARGAGVPNSVNLSTGPGGERIAVLTYTQGTRAGIYTFKAGRLSSIERLPEPAKPVRPASKRRHG